MTATTTGSPARTRRMGGITSPSCQMSRESAGMEPGLIPPTSEWCARVTE